MLRSGKTTCQDDLGLASRLSLNNDNTHEERRNTFSYFEKLKIRNNSGQCKAASGPEDLNIYSECNSKRRVFM